MPRIPTYDATIGGRAAQAPTISMNSYAPLNAATNQFADTAVKVFNDVGEKFMEAQRTNTVLDEENKMMDHFFKLQDEAKKQDPDKQVQWFDEQTKAYREEMRTRVGDMKAVKQLENSWQNFTMRGMYQVRDDYRKKVASDGIAKAMEGDDAFLKQVYSMYDNPTLLELGLKDREDTYDKLVEAGHLNAAQAQQYKEQVRHQVAEGRAAFVVEKDPYNAVKMLNNENEFVDLMPGKRAAYINMAQGEIKRIETQKRMEERERRMEAKSYGLELASYASRLADDASKSNVISSDFTAAYRDLSKYRNLSPSINGMVERMERIGNEVAAVTEVKTMRPEELKKVLSDQVSNWEALSVEDREKTRTIQKVSESQDKLLKTGKHLEYMAEYNLNKGVTPISINSGLDSIERRLTQVRYAQDTFGGNPNILTDTEADTFANAWKAGDESERRKIGNILYRLSGGTDKGAPNPQRLDVIAKQMKLKEGSIADEISFALQGDMTNARIMAEGRKRIENNKDRYAVTQALTRDINRSIDDLNLSVIDPNDQLRKQAVAGITNLYVGMATETMDTVDPSLIEKAVSAYFGPVVEQNGHKTLAWADGEDSAGHTQLWRSMTPDLLKTTHGGELPMVRQGSTMREIPFNEVAKKGVLLQEDGKYVLYMPNKKTPWSQAEFVKAVDSKGKPYTVDVETVLPDLKRIRDQRYIPYGDPNYVGP